MPCKEGVLRYLRRVKVRFFTFEVTDIAGPIQFFFM
jgi:hypothetical protein